MPAAARFMWRNLINEISSVTLTATSATVPVANLAHHQLGKAWRTSGVAEESVTIDLGTTSEIVRVVAVAGHNLRSGASVEVLQSSDGANFTSVASINPFVGTTGFGEGGFGEGGFGGGIISITGEVQAIVMLFFAALTKRYWRITLRDAGNADTFIKVGRIFLGDYWEPAAQIMRQWSVEVIDETSIEKSIGGQKWRNIRNSFNRVSFRLPHLSKSEAIENFLNFARRIGSKDSMFVSLFPDGSVTLKAVTNLYGKFVQAPGISGPAISIYDTGEVLFESDQT